METRELKVPGSFEFTPILRGDERGSFHEWFKADVMRELIGHDFAALADGLAQANCSLSAVGTLRGIHFAQVPPGQAKYVTCFVGAVVDYAIDLRADSATFGVWDTVLLDDTDRRAIYVPEGVGHAFVALEDRSLVSYLCSTGYDPEREHTVNPFDPDLKIEWPTHDRAGNRLEFVLSERDTSAQSLAQARAAGLLG